MDDKFDGEGGCPDVTGFAEDTSVADEPVILPENFRKMSDKELFLFWGFTPDQLVEFTDGSVAPSYILKDAITRNKRGLVVNNNQGSDTSSKTEEADPEGSASETTDE